MKNTNLHKKEKQLKEDIKELKVKIEKISETLEYKELIRVDKNIKEYETEKKNLQRIYETMEALLLSGGIDIPKGGKKNNE